MSVVLQQPRCKGQRSQSHEAEVKVGDLVKASFSTPLSTSFSHFCEASGIIVNYLTFFNLPRPATAATATA